MSRNEQAIPCGELSDEMFISRRDMVIDRASKQRLLVEKYQKCESKANCRHHLHPKLRSKNSGHVLWILHGSAD